jgi:hypothetical protein
VRRGRERRQLLQQHRQEPARVRQRDASQQPRSGGDHNRSASRQGLPDRGHVDDSDDDHRDHTDDGDQVDRHDDHHRRDHTDDGDQSGHDARANHEHLCNNSHAFGYYLYRG